MSPDDSCTNERAVCDGDLRAERVRSPASASENLTFQLSEVWRRLPVGFGAVVNMGRLALAVGRAVGVITACSHSSPVAEPGVAAGSFVDALIVSVEEVRRIANYHELTARKSRGRN